MTSKENLNSEEQVRKLPRTDTRSQPSITAMTSAEDVLIEINATNLKTVTERLR